MIKCTSFFLPITGLKTSVILVPGRIKNKRKIAKGHQSRELPTWQYFCIFLSQLQANISWKFCNDEYMVSQGNAPFLDYKAKQNHAFNNTSFHKAKRCILI